MDTPLTTPAQPEQSSASTRVSRALILILLLPCLGSAVSQWTSETGPPLTVTGDRPALVFESYLADRSHITA